MSMLNLVVTADYALVITDSGYFDTASGNLVDLRPKSVISERHNLVIASAGRIPLDYIVPGLIECEQMGQDDFVEAIPHIVKAAINKFDLDTEWPSIIVYAGYSTAQQRPFGAMFVTAKVDGHEPFVAYPQSAVFLPATDGLKSKMRKFIDNPEDFLPYREKQFLRRQSYFNFGQMHDPILGIAGDIDVVVVSADGFRVETIDHFPAELGQRVKACPVCA